MGPASGQATADLFERSLATLVRSWAYLSTGSPGAEVIEADGATIASFVHAPDREFLNNALLPRGVADLTPALDVVERVYAERGIGRYAVWLHESDTTAVGQIEARGYAYDSSTRTMAMPVADLAAPDTEIPDLVELSPTEFWQVGDDGGLLPELPVAGAHFHAARLGGENVATLMAFDHEGDCGFYMVGTVPAARRRGLATALSAHAVVEAARRGCATVSLQSTPMAEGVYAGVGFRDLGRFDEYLPPGAA